MSLIFKLEKEMGLPVILICLDLNQNPFIHKMALVITSRD